jgi:hypothetical protein
MKRLLTTLGLVLAAACDGGQESTGATSDASLDPGDSPAAEVINTDENFDCRGTVRGTFANVFVPAGATCRLQRSTVNGNVLAREGSRLYVSDTRVAGNIDGVEARVVQVKGGSLGGSIQIADGSSAGELGAAVDGTVLTQGNIQIIKMNTGSIRISGVQLKKGNIKVEENSTGSSLEVVRNQVAQNIQVNKNSGSGSKAVRGNRVFQIVQCKENTSPFTGGPNTAAEAEGQCF